MKSAMETRLEPGTVGELIVSALQRHADRVAFLDGPHRLTYRELGVRIARRIDQKLFYRFIYAGMLLTGLKLVWDALAL